MENQESVYYLKAFFEGRVQGVGFRYSTSQIAKGYELTGYVTNLSDGRVELFAEGEAEECTSFIKTVEEEMDGFVRKVEKSSGIGGRKHKSFSIV
ncbi:acylphosphatase [Puniceicoccaceae bacterium K14]|nr:acylphosphatase [Puniceicoccaceae bacterium K14]